MKQVAALLLLGGMNLCVAHYGRASDGGMLINPRSAHTATRLANGRVLLVGGLVAGGSVTSTCEIYDPATNSWTATGSLNQARDSHGSVLLSDGRVLAVGGAGSNFLLISSAEIYDPSTGKWTLTGSMSVARVLSDPVALTNGKVLVAGNGGDAKSSELYDPAIGTWAPTGSLSQRRDFASQMTVLTNGRVLIAGGHSQRVGYLSETKLYNPATGVWTKQGSLANGRIYHAQVLLPDGRVLIAGGVVNPPSAVKVTRSTEIYDPNTRLWSSSHPLGMERFQFTANLQSNGQVLAAGGNDDPTAFALASLEQYDPTSGAWQTLAQTLATPRTAHTATTLFDGSIILAGGTDASGKLIPSAELLAAPQ
jgi:hypothetical protein